MALLVNTITIFIAIGVMTYMIWMVCDGIKMSREFQRDHDELTRNLEAWTQRMEAQDKARTSKAERPAPELPPTLWDHLED